MNNIKKLILDALFLRGAYAVSTSAYNTFYSRYNFFNQFIRLTNDYNKFQTTYPPYSSKINTVELNDAVLGFNILKILEAQMSFLKPETFSDMNYPKFHIFQFIWLCMAGYTKPNDMITSNLKDYFSENETPDHVFNRMRLMSTNVSADGLTFTPPPFVTAVIGTDWSKSSLPTGKMMAQLIVQCLKEAEADLMIKYPSGAPLI